ncbi:uncharacterized protein TrAFT101_009370 [Trichoderma asperellum]|uniref:uncharacterized protein n=1 Tax=Trichoderma asperellum TaxID=101201 RepID=UPI003329E906|nr:hypothetical protein TrAFT101_009370 [Trichoderma asperellum]
MERRQQRVRPSKARNRPRGRFQVVSGVASPLAPGGRWPAAIGHAPVAALTYSPTSRSLQGLFGTLWGCWGFWDFWGTPGAALSPLKPP